jgi:uncharacterized protein
MHTRKRHIEAILTKRAKIFPVLGLVGVRQVGKSTFLIQQWCSVTNANYITFDEKEVVTRAKNYPAQLLKDESDNQNRKLVIDEAQKVPHIFDSIKALVDQKKRMGSFMLSGSVEFSAKTGVRESLAGRMGISMLYPMTLRELSNQNLHAPWITLQFNTTSELNPKSIETWLLRGGMPLFCNLSDDDERFTLINSWLEAICYRDINQLKDGKYDGDIAFNLIKYIAHNELFSISRASHDLSVSSALIQKHLSALESLFLIYSIPSLENPRAQSRYYIFDAGVLNALRGIGPTDSLQQKHACLTTLILNEINAQYEYSGKLKPKIFHYRTRGGAEIDLVLKTKDKLIGIECHMSDNIRAYAQRGMKSFLSRYPNAKGYFVAPIQKPYNLEKNLTVIPWNAIG